MSKKFKKFVLKFAFSKLEKETFEVKVGSGPQPEFYDYFRRIALERIEEAYKRGYCFIPIVFKGENKEFGFNVNVRKVNYFHSLGYDKNHTQIDHYAGVLVNDLCKLAEIHQERLCLKDKLKKLNSKDLKIRKTNHLLVYPDFNK